MSTDPFTPSDPMVGETFVQGKDPVVARGLLAAADELGLDALVVRTARGGFIVPDAVWDTYNTHRLAASGQDY